MRAMSDEAMIEWLNAIGRRMVQTVSFECQYWHSYSLPALEDVLTCAGRTGELLDLKGQLAMVETREELQDLHERWRPLEEALIRLEILMRGKPHTRMHFLEQ